MPFSDDQKLERFIHEALRDLPARHAPPTLSARVLEAVQQRAARPWWRKSFAHWPLPVRGGFVAASLTLMLGILWLLSGMDAVRLAGGVLPRWEWFGAVAAVVSAFADFFTIVFRTIQPPWLYGGLAFLATVYAVLFGLGATAYRTLQNRR